MPESYIAHYAEALGHGRAIMRVDVVIEGKLDHSYTEGSPAPIDTVRAYERRVTF